MKKHNIKVINIDKDRYCIQVYGPHFNGHIIFNSKQLNSCTMILHPRNEHILIEDNGRYTIEIERKTKNANTKLFY